MKVKVVKANDVVTVCGGVRFQLGSNWITNIMPKCEYFTSLTV